MHGREHVVTLQAVRLLDPPQFATPVIQVGAKDAPAVLIDIEHTLGINVPLARLQGRFHHPDPVHLIAQQILVEVVGLDDVVVLEAAIGQLVGVVRHQHFLLAQQFPVVLVGRAVVQVDGVVGAQAVRGAQR
ncbi:hypothetical protein D3C79_744800 [compost metagenome]